MNELHLWFQGSLMKEVAHSHISISFVQLSLFCDCRGEAMQRRTSITAGNKMFTNHDRRFCDHRFVQCLCIPMRFNWSDIAIPTWNVNLRTPNSLHCNCPWSFGATFQAFYIWSEWCCIIHLGLANSFIYLALTGYVTIELESRILQVGTRRLTENLLNRRMTGWGIWLWILVWLEMVEQSSVARGNLNLLQSQIVDKIKEEPILCFLSIDLVLQL